MNIKVFQVNPFFENCYVLYSNNKAIIVDCGALTSVEQDSISDFLDSNNLKVEKLLNTHLHLDHSFGNNFIAEKYGVKPLAHKDDEFMIGTMEMQAELFGIPEKVTAQPLGGYIEENQDIVVEDMVLTPLHVPGHSAGSICYYIKSENTILVGDVLFKQSIGRTDLPGGNYEQLITNINSKLLTLPDETIVLSGHGPATSIGYEKANNPFLK